jgi:hypothetical protein
LPEAALFFVCLGALAVPLETLFFFLAAEALEEALEGREEAEAGEEGADEGSAVVSGEEERGREDRALTLFGAR